MRERIKRLWELCFDDSTAFTELYFRLRYNNEVNIAIESGEEVIAALQMLPYPMTFCNNTAETAYISGICTHPDFRNRGVMSELMAQAFGRMYRNGIAFSTLIPAHPWLFEYYARMGYATVFRYKKQMYQLPIDVPACQSHYQLKTFTEYDASIFQYLDRKLQERSCYVQHTEADFRVILADLRLDNGAIFALYRQEKLIGLAIGYTKTQATDNLPSISISHSDRSNDAPCIQIGELVADDFEAEQALLSNICQTTGAQTLYVIAPSTQHSEGEALGMARIISPQIALMQYAAAHPEVEWSICLHDEHISANNGYYYLANGKCKFRRTRRLGVHSTLSIGELTQLILLPEQPYMSLMLN